MFLFSKNLFYFLIIIYLLIFPIATQTCNSCNSIIHHETKLNLLIFNAFSFNDEIVILLTKYADTTSLYMDPKLEFRYMHRDGTVEASKLTYNLEFNFCPDSNGYYPFYHKQNSDYFIIIYVDPISASF